LSSYNILIPKCIIAGSGEVGIYWEVNNVYIEITFNNKGNFWVIIENGIAISDNF
jgi:hypothetical protein